MSGTLSRPPMSEPNQKPPSRAGERRQRTKDRERAYRLSCGLVSRRDRHLCRVCQHQGTHHHHIRFRSQGRDDSPANLILLCAVCHADVHAYRLTITGNADAEITITRAQS